MYKNGSGMSATLQLQSVCQPPVRAELPIHGSSESGSIPQVKAPFKQTAVQLSLGPFTFVAVCFSEVEA